MKASFTTNEVKATVKAWGKGGAYVSVPSAWKGKEVKVILIDSSP